MNVLSLFDGMSCGQIALRRSGIKIDNYFASEIDKWSIMVTQKNFPDTIQLGDINNLDINNLPKIDLLIGGSPCQGFSFSGKGLNFNDPRSKLFFNFVDIMNKLNPKYFLLENVVMKKEFQEVITSYMGVEPILINSSLVSAQNRKRLYWTNIPDIEQPEDKGVLWGDVRERGVDSQKYYYSDKALQWLARHSRNNNKLLRIHADDEKMQMIEASHSKKYSSQRFFGIIDSPSEDQAVASMRGRFLVNGIRQDSKGSIAGKSEQYIEFRYDGKTNTLTTANKDNIVVPFTLPNRINKDSFFFRYITPLECERLQTVPDGYTDSVSDTQRYRMLGNGWTVDVISHIFNKIYRK